jgi:hypothetical protein
MLPGKSRKVLNLTMLALESNRVIGLRMAKLMRGGWVGSRDDATEHLLDPNNTT